MLQTAKSCHVVPNADASSDVAKDRGALDNLLGLPPYN